MSRSITKRIWYKLSYKFSLKFKIPTGWDFVVKQADGQDEVSFMLFYNSHLILIISFKFCNYIFTNRKRGRMPSALCRGRQGWHPQAHSEGTVKGSTSLHGA